MAKQRWADLPPAQRRGIISAAVVQLTLLAAALIDIRRRPQDQIRGSKRLWTGLAFVNFVGPIAYFIVGRRRKRNGAG